MQAPLIGLAYVAFSSAIRGFTGGALDTFFYLGPALLHMNFTQASIIYLAGPPLGAIVGHFLYELLFTDAKIEGSNREPINSK